MSRSVTLTKGKNNMIGISIGGGAPMCPVLYVVQVGHVCTVYIIIIYSTLCIYAWRVCRPTLTSIYCTACVHVMYVNVLLES